MDALLTTIAEAALRMMLLSLQVDYLHGGQNRAHSCGVPEMARVSHNWGYLLIEISTVESNGFSAAHDIAGLRI